jgi:(E)-4-hydroxy-3-methylbut-2-enyl-diphosphate synthase
MQIKRKKTNIVKIGNIKIGGTCPVVIQSMTSTDTQDVDKTLNQIIKLHNAGSQLVRLTINNDKSAQAITKIKDKLLQKNISVPLIGDFHFNGDRLLSRNKECAQILDKYRINPGNARDTQFHKIIQIAIKHKKAVRIGVNWGSLDQKLLAAMLDKNNKKKQPLPLHAIQKKAVAKSAIQSAKIAMDIGLDKNKIILSAKMSAPTDLIAVYKKLSANCNYPLHLGLTEAGLGDKAVISSVAALSPLLMQGIGDTIRLSLTPTEKQSRTKEVIVAKQLLQALGLNSYQPEVIACPGCGRTTSYEFIKLAQTVDNFIQKNYHKWQHKKNINHLKVAVMGCVVNGPGESKNANIGISLPGTGEKQFCPIYINGEKIKTIKLSNAKQQFIDILNNYIQDTD